MTGRNEGPPYPKREGQTPNQMSLRDWFAGQALAGIAANTDWWACATDDQVARQAYLIADEMLAQRDGKWRPMTARLTWHQSYPGGRIVASLGQIEVGAVFPDASGARWSCFLDRTRHFHAQHKPSRTTQAAQNALAGAVSDWLRAAGLRQEDAT